MIALRVYPWRIITKRIEVLGLSSASLSLPTKHVNIYHIATESKRHIRRIGHVHCELQLFRRFQINDGHLKSLAAKVPCKA